MAVVVVTDTFIIAAPTAEKKTDYLKVSEIAVATVNIPGGIVNGMKPGPVLCISGEVHGTEYSSIDAVIPVLRQTDPSKLSVTLLLSRFQNMTAFETQGPQGGMSTTFQCPIDGINLNRIFPSNRDGTMDYQIAVAFMSQIASKPDCYTACHGGDLNEELVYRSRGIRRRRERIITEVLAASFDCEALSITRVGGGSIEAASKMGQTVYRDGTSM
jgi:hypothetical protein